MIFFCFLQKSKDNDNDMTSFEQTQIDQAKKIMKPFVLRRLKNDVLKSLPPKTEDIIRLNLEGSQKEKYTELVQSYSTEAGIVKATSEQNGMSIMVEMRKLANHPLLMRFVFYYLSL